MSGLANDDEAIDYWLQERAGASPHTWRRFSRCARLLRVWMEYEGVQQLADLTAHAVSGVTRWLAAPPAELVAPEGAPRTGAAYLFRAGMTAAQLRDTMSILHGMCEILVAARYLDRNPFAVTARGKFAPRKKADPKALNGKAWQMYLEASRELEPRHRWFAALVYHLLLRRAEAAALAWSHFSPDPQDPTGHGWRVFIRGKGGSEEYLPLSKLAVEEMTRWRLAIGRPPYPAPGEVTSVWADSRKFVDWPPNPETLNRWAQRIASEAMKRVDSDALDARLITMQLTSLTTHGLRHSRATHLLQGGSTLADAQAALRHRNITTTGVYVSSDLSRLRERLNRS